MSNKGIRINNTQGLGVVILGETMISALKTVDFTTVKTVCELLCNENVFKVFCTLDFAEPFSEGEIAARCGLSADEMQPALFQLMKLNICEGDAGGRLFLGINAYIFFTALAGVYLASADGHKDIYSISRDYNR